MVMVMEINEISRLLVELLVSQITIATHYYKRDKQEICARMWVIENKNKGPFLSRKWYLS